MREEKIMLITFIGVVILIAALISFISAILFLYQRKQHAFLRQLEDAKDKYESGLLKSQLEVQEQTLRHISRDLHDNIGHYITLAKLHLNTIGWELGEKGAGKAEYAVDLLTKALDDLRDLSKSLSLELIHVDGLPKAIESQVNQLKKTAHYDIDFQIKGNYNYMEEQKEIILFRILQEAINNIIRHAQARTIKIMLDCTPEAVSLLVKDDGKGFITEPFIAGPNPYKNRGGLSNMLARATLIKAGFSIESELGAGTLVRITLPLNHEQYGPLS